MGIQFLQKFIENQCPTACVPVDLLKIARSVVVRRGGGGARRGGMYGGNQGIYGMCPGGATSRLCLVVDGECCLDRLYGGYFSDWVCGGQWNRMVQYLAVLIQTIRSNDIELTVFFNGGLESQRLEEWIKNQQNERKKITQVLKHVESKGTPPPKVWWVPPVCLIASIRMALRHLNVSVVCTVDDHHQEVIAYCRENNFHGLLAEDAEYAIFDPPRYFSSEQLKLTYKGSLETKEFILEEVAKQLDLHPSRFCLFAALLGNYLLTEETLLDFYATICPESKGKQAFTDTLITAICNFVRSLPSIDNLDAVGAQVFGTGAKNAGSILKLKDCVQYYMNGTKDGFLRYRPPITAGRKQEPGHYVPTWSNAHPSSPTSPLPPSLPNTAKFASETQEPELSNYQESAVANPQIVIEPPTQGISSITNNDVQAATNGTSSSLTHVGNGFEKARQTVNGTLLLSSSSSSTSTPSRLSPETSWTASGPTKSADSTPAPGGYPYHSRPTVRIPSVPLEVVKTASERHQKGLMTTWIYQVLTQGEIRIPLCLEDDVPDELPSSALLYRPVRQMVYAVIFNLHHLQFQTKQKAEQNPATSPPVPDILVKEWVWSKHNQYRTPDLVKAEPLGWAVPTVQRLWFGSTLDDKKRRMRAFLTCMNCDTPFMLNASYVPQHLLIMCCILRYILSRYDIRILRRHELNAFLAMAVSPQLMDAQAMQSVQLPVVTSRGVQLASLFMRGVECALFANDACGSPIPWLTCCPWLFFDGKLFHYKLLKAEEAKNLIDLCEGQTDQVLKVERMRQAILKGLKVEFARPPLPVPQISNRIPNAFGPTPMGFLPTGAAWPIPGRGRTQFNNGRRPVLARGGQLEIAGVVVGSWGPNYGTTQRTSNRGGGSSVHMAPQVTSVGGPRRLKYGNAMGGPYVNRGGMPSYGTKRPPPRIRRPVGNQNHNQPNPRSKVKRTASKTAPASTTATTELVNHVDAKTEPSENEIVTKEEPSAEATEQEEERNIQPSSNPIKDEVIDEEVVEVNTSPVIMKKLSQNGKEEVPASVDAIVLTEDVAKEE